MPVINYFINEIDTDNLKNNIYIKKSGTGNDFLVDLGKVDEEEAKVTVKANNKNGSFTGTYANNTTVPAKSLFLNDNKFWYSAGLTKMKAFRAYFTLSDVLTEKELSAARILMVFNDGETTGVGDALRLMNSEKVNSEVYNLNGQRVMNPVKGLYIVNGRKVVIK